MTQKLQQHGFIAGAVLLTAGLIAVQAAQAQTYSETVLHSFTANGGDGAFPYAGLISDAKGTLYGTTDSDGYTAGVVFKVTQKGKESVLYSFAGGTDGSHPDASLIRDKSGNLYSTTLDGGSDGVGTVFKVSKTGKENLLHSFTGVGGDGANPFAELIRDKTGSFYGTTEQGGAGCYCGTVFKLDSTGTETVLYAFTGTGSDGAYPLAGLARDKAGRFYGTTMQGGAFGVGTVFKLTTSGTETVLYSFTGGSDGYFPIGTLIRDRAGNLYGTTYGGGNGSGDSGAGIVFKVNAAGVETVLYTFTGGADGQHPYAGLVRDAKGNLYGSTRYGGSGYGVVFKLDTTGSETVLYSFTGGSDGALPYLGRLLRDSSGHLYGTAEEGGDLNCNGGYGCGTVWKLTP